MMDITGAGVGLVILSPLCLLVSVMILLCDGCPILFTVRCYGIWARPFKQYKFRSMKANQGEIVCQMYDPRVTRFGRIIRSTAIDEIPQLWNILKGDMSFVGPRPVAVDEIRRRCTDDDGSMHLMDIPCFRERCHVRPGLTGFAQLYLPKYADLPERFRYDATYIDQWSLWLDIKFFVVSVKQTLRGKWEKDRDYTLDVKLP